LQIQFATPHQYLLLHRNVKHLLLLWKKERKRQLYIVTEEKETMLLQYPGETYVDMMLQEIEPLLFQTLETEKGPFPALLGATFAVNERNYAMYYHKDHPTSEVYFFEIGEEKLLEIPAEDYEQIVRLFATQFPEYISLP
jgi:hypothetical protein